MARRISFEEFDRALVTGEIPFDKLADYLCLDEDAPVPRLIFRPGVLTNGVPAHYDVDERIYQYVRSRRDRQRVRRETYAYLSSKSVVAEGDSWFDLPGFLGRRAIADWIDEHRRFRMNNIARWGHTLDQIVNKREYITVLRDERPDYFMFGAGGNDLQEALEDGGLIHDYDPQRPEQDYITPDGHALLDEIEGQLRGVFHEVSMLYPMMPILCHAYDYPRPNVGRGRYIGKYLERRGIRDALAQAVVISLIDELNRRVAQVAAQFPTVRYLNCRRQTDLYTWRDDMHPSDDGFEALAKLFEDSMATP